MTAGHEKKKKKKKKKKKRKTAMNNNEKQALHDRLVQAFADHREGFAECMDTEAAARSDKDVDLTEYDQAVEAAETIYDEPDFYEWFTDRYPGKIAEYDGAAA